MGSCVCVLYVSCVCVCVSVDERKRAQKLGVLPHCTHPRCTHTHTHTHCTHTTDTHTTPPPHSTISSQPRPAYSCHYHPYSLLTIEGLKSGGNKSELLERLAEHEKGKSDRSSREEEDDEAEDEGEDEGENEEEDDTTDSDVKSPEGYVCDAVNARKGRCQRAVKVLGAHCHSHQVGAKRLGRKSPATRSRTPRAGLKRPAKHDSPLDTKRARSQSPEVHGSSSPNNNPTGSTTLLDLEHLKKILELSRSITGPIEPAPVLNTVSHHDIHEFHMDMMHGLMGMPDARSSTAQSRTRRAQGVPNEQAPAAQTVKSVLSVLELQEYEAAFHSLGVREVADLVNLEECELDTINLTTVEKRRFHRKIGTM
jgi:hypothetical protein